MSILRQDLRHALRMIARQPGVTLVAILTLALGIGANTAIFSAVDAVLLRPLPYENPDQLVMVWEKRPAEGVLDNVVAPADYVDWAKLNSSFESIAAYTPLTVDLTGVGDPVKLPAAAVSPAFFDVFRTRPQLGRSFRPEEGIVGNQRVVILGHGLWLRMFGSDPSIVGRQILLNGVGHEVVGVLPATFQFADSTIELWAPLALEGQPQPLSRAQHQFFVYARMKPGVTLQQARTDMDRVGAQLSEQFPVTNRRHGVWVSALSDQIAGPDPAWKRAEPEPSRWTAAAPRSSGIRPAHCLRQRRQPAFGTGGRAPARDGRTCCARRGPRAARRPDADREPGPRSDRWPCWPDRRVLGDSVAAPADARGPAGDRFAAVRTRPARPGIYVRYCRSRPASCSGSFPPGISPARIFTTC